MKALWLGLFIIVALVLFAWLVLFLKPGFGDGRVELNVRFSNIDNVNVGTRVTFAGKPVGEVVKIQEIADPRKAPADASGNLYIYELTLKVDSSVKVFSYDEIIFATSGLLGEKSIAIIPKAPPPGALSAQNVTDEVLYAHSTDKIEQTLNKLASVADIFGNTLTQVGSFIQSNSSDFNTGLKNFSSAFDEMRTFMVHASEAEIISKISNASDRLSLTMRKAEDFFTLLERQQLVENMGLSFANLSLLSNQICQGEGTFAQLVQSDALYFQVMTVTCQLRAILDDMRNYGLLYQFDRKWRRVHDAEKCHYRSNFK
jgi:phospholipid/cholesterol/gamma-HCH transport system substrate-binding protein